MDEEVLAAHLQELRRGSVVVAALALLDDPRYGYALLGELHEAGFDVDANTLYPLLRRLERQGLLRSEWNTDETRPRKFYVLSDEGIAIRDTLADEWSALDDRVRHVLKGDAR
jgi:PadR family transcriptional regulator PadR